MIRSRCSTSSGRLPGCKGDWGFSFSSRTGVRGLVAGRIGTTLFVMGLAFVVGLLIAIPIGVLAAVKQYSVFDQVATTIAFFGFSIPTFFSGLLAILFFSIKLGWLPFIYESNTAHGGLLGLAANGCASRHCR